MLLTASEKQTLSSAEQHMLRIARTRYISSTENVRSSIETYDKFVSDVPVSHAKKAEVWVQLGTNRDTVIMGKITDKKDPFALMFFNKEPFEGLFIIVHSSQLFHDKPDVESMLTTENIKDCIAGSYAFQQSNDRFVQVDKGFITLVFGVTRADNDPLKKRMREDELYNALTVASHYSPVHVMGRLARLPGKKPHPCNCGCLNLVSGGHICEVCRNGVYEQDCFGLRNDHNFDGICKPCFNAGLQPHSHVNFGEDDDEESITSSRSSSNSGPTLAASSDPSSSKATQVPSLILDAGNDATKDAEYDTTKMPMSNKGIIASFLIHF
jgi:hypothetical protein